MLFSNEKEETSPLVPTPSDLPPSTSHERGRPTQSILLNGPNGSPSPSRTNLPNVDVDTPTPIISTSTSSSSSSPFISGISSPSSKPPPTLNELGRRASTTKISFAPLPSVPPEYKLQRRNSITLGVASRKNLLTGTGQGGGAASNAAAGQSGKIYMSDADWEIYKKQYESKGADPVDLGQLAKSGAKALWGKVKRARSSSQSSQASTSTTSSSIEPQSPPPSSSGMGIVPLPVPPSPSPSTGGLGTVTEEEHDSPTMESNVRSRGSGGLSMIPGSPPPRPRSLSTNSDTSNFTSASEDASSASGSGSGSGNESVNESPGISPTSPTHEAYIPWNHGHHSQHNNLSRGIAPGSGHLYYPGHEEGDGDATPRRRASPPPPMKSTLKGEEEEEEPTTHSISISGVASSNGTSPQQEQKEQRRVQATTAQHWERERDHERDKRSAVLGFDQERFGHVLTLDQNKGKEQREI